MTGQMQVSMRPQIGYDFLMPKFRLRRDLRDAYRFPGFVPARIIRGVFGDPQARVVSLKRRQKKQRVESVGVGTAAFTIRSFVWCETCPVASIAFIWSYLCAE